MTFTTKETLEVIRSLGLSLALDRLAGWVRRGIIGATAPGKGGDRRFTTRDLVKAACFVWLADLVEPHVLEPAVEVLSADIMRVMETGPDGDVVAAECAQVLVLGVDPIDFRFTARLEKADNISINLPHRDVWRHPAENVIRVHAGNMAAFLSARIDDAAERRVAQ